jgi:hypothetical protein
MIKTFTMRWEGHLARMEAVECIYDIGGKATSKDTTKKTKT